jgi:hypothetical protein
MMTIPFVNQEKSTIAKNNTQSRVNFRYITCLLVTQINIKK